MTENKKKIKKRQPNGKNKPLSPIIKAGDDDGKIK